MGAAVLLVLLVAGRLTAGGSTVGRNRRRQFTTPHEDPYRLGWESGLDKLAAVLDHADGSLTREGGNGA
jgi:hypothetical protein